MRLNVNDYKGSLPFVPAKAVDRNGSIICPNCKERHGLFYRRHSAEKLTLNYFCDKVVRRGIHKSNGGFDEARLYTLMGQCELVGGLPIKEEWTPKYRESFQKEHHDNLIQ